jgi:hypothetical protein
MQASGSSIPDEERILSRFLDFLGRAMAIASDEVSLRPKD